MEYAYLCTQQIIGNMGKDKTERKGPAPAGGHPAPKRGGESRERKPNWREYTATVEDIEQFLGDNIQLRHNVVTGRTECRILESDLFAEWIAEGLPTGQWLPVSDRIVNTLWRALSKKKRVNTKDIYGIIESDFSPDFNPFLFYLDRLPPWNGEDHILAMSVSVSVRGEVEEQMLFAEYLKKWLVGMVAGWVDPEVVNNVILVLIGEQGSYKTTWFSHLLPPELRQYFRIKTNSSRMTKDDLLVLSEYGLVCYEELETMRPSELNQLKAAVTMPSVDERRPYGRYTEHRRHIASFCGTGNNIQFLSDPTGNRRWLPFEVESIEPPQEHPIDYVSVYAQAYALYRQGFRYWFSRDEILRLAEHNRQFETPRLEAELVDVYFRRPGEQEPGEYMPVSRAMQIIGGNTVQQLSAVRLGRAFMEQGFRQVRQAHSRGYVVVRRSAEDIQARMRAMTCDADEAF